ncbi:hypothetical protein [Nostoc sp. NMS4]|uniref:hypothetical protein n=1 Tax=Nostoc sp. NMS4 TaxID=2815390 RepID=UPI0025FE4771|nr:hypothetical protein [Nostoc sp. NMS4]MBN3927121.1 hypothetical protein [Nostoc sp. NMS4]
MSNLTDRALITGYKGEQTTAFWLTLSSSQRLMVGGREGLIELLKDILFNKFIIKSLRTSQNTKYPGNFAVYQLNLVVGILQLLIDDIRNPLK